MADEPLPVLALVYDLIFATKITTAARSLGTPMKLIRDPAKLAGENGRLLLVDLNLPGAIEAAGKWQYSARQSVVGFVSHVDAGTAARARAAGIGSVMARSRFVELLGSGLLFSEGKVAQAAGEMGENDESVEMDRGDRVAGEHNGDTPSGRAAANDRADSQGV